MRGDGRGRAVAGGRDRLARGVRPDVAGGEQAGALGPHPRVRRDAAAFVERDDALEERGVRDAPDVDEDGRDVDRRRLAAREVADAETLDAAVAEELLGDRPVRTSTCALSSTRRA